MTEMSRCFHLDIGEAFIRWTLSTSNRNRMRRVQPMRCVAIRASTVRACVSHLKRRLPGCKGETLSLAASLVAIAIGSLAFWLNQPAHLFNGGAPTSASKTEESSASAIHAPLNRLSPPLTHGLLSLELLSAMQRDSRRLMLQRDTSANLLCERKTSSTASPASHLVRAHSACTNRATTR
jgi:hypothetical protein